MMKPYRVVPPSLIDPAPGSVNSRPDTGITISLPIVAKTKEKLCVRIDGQLMYERGREAGGWRITREWRIDGRHLICFESKDHLSAHDHLVQIELVGLAKSINQRFVTKGAVHVCMAPQDEPVCRVPGGFFWVDGVRWKFPDTELTTPAWFGRGMVIGQGCVLYRRAGLCAWRDGTHIRTVPVPRRMLEPQMKLQMQADRSGVFLAGVCINTGELWVVRDSSMHVWVHARAKDIGMTHGWLHINMGDHSRHMPSTYAPAIGDQDLSDLFRITTDDHIPTDSWSMRWADGHHVWYNRRSLVAHVDPDIFLGKSDAVLWTASAIGEDISSVELTGGKTMLLNGNLIVNNSNPITWEHL